MNRKILKLVFLILILFVSAFSLETDIESKAKVEISQRLQKWSEDFNAKKVPEVCELFAADLVASYPGTKDRNYHDMCQHFKAILQNGGKQFRYEIPEIEQIIVHDNVAVVRLVWTLKISENQSLVNIIKEKGLDIFRRQKDGSWKIAISYAYPLKDS